ncbi:hypothetical protein GPL15_23855 [Clostridium sp. MCC353]|uniref:hypothetical protein n=1 Tax=Clostridium sp. MCC353 TaxID=2592646 RepID=UPI001C019A09|nr:hypothetical protein [Clostridium sp. MCC353]MBT9779517.1 hypothetical protein [Clostridium sp. MCC353]
MSYDLMVFNHLKVPYELGPLRQWFRTHMEYDVLPDTPPAIFRAFLENLQKVFPSMNHCAEERWEYACEYEVHEDFVYLCFGYSVAEEAHDIVKRQSKIENLAFWDVSQTFDRAFPITLPADQWPMVLEAKWIKYGKHFVYSYEQIRKVLVQMKTIERSSVCLTDRYGNYIQAGGFNDAFIVEVRKYIDAVTYQHMRADLKQESLAADAFVSINDFRVRVPESQILTKKQVCSLFQEFTDGNPPEDWNFFWKRIEI